jgi:predicted SprT family Zn-dependent metalloprotease
VQDRIQKIIAAVDNCFVIAKQLYPDLHFDKPVVDFNLRGCSTGITTHNIPEDVPFGLRFNKEMIQRDEETFNFILTNTVPHEVAHCICFMHPKLGSKHDDGWRNLCLALGGNGDTTHSLPVIFGKGHTWEYATTKNYKVRFSDTKHQQIQQGDALRIISDGNDLGFVNRQSPCFLIALNGRRLETPLALHHVQPVSQGSIIDCTGELKGVPGVHQASLRPTAEWPDGWVPSQCYQGNSKAEISRKIMKAGHSLGKTYEDIIFALQRVNGYSRQLARATFKANREKAGLPEIVI